MAKSRGKGVVLAGLVAGVLSFLSKKENRDKAMSYLGQLKREVSSSQKGAANVKQKVDDFFYATQSSKHTTGTNDEKIASFMAMSPNATEKPQKETLEDIATTAAQAADSVLEGNHMIDEGAQTTVAHYNEQQHQQNHQDFR